MIEIDLTFWLINGFTLFIIISPLFIFISPWILLLLLISIPTGIFIFYFHFSLRRSTSSFDQFRNITIAHRGGRPLKIEQENDEFPENTMAAYRWASTMNGADGIELDVWLSKDNVPMVNHDGYLEHTFAECREFISSLTCEQLKQLKYFKRNKRDVFNHIGCEAIPTLEEVIIFLEPTRLKLMIEIKEIEKIPLMAQIIDDLFKKYPFLYERAYCAAFHPYNLYAIRKRNPRITTGFLFVSDLTAHLIRNASQTPRPLPIYLTKNFFIRWMIDSLAMWFGSPTGLRFLGADLACIEKTQISLKLLEEYKRTNIVLCAWSVNEPEQNRWLRAHGVTVITDTLFSTDPN